MNTEETKILNPQSEATHEEQVMNNGQTSSPAKSGNKAGYAVGGFAVGAMTGAAVSAHATPSEEKSASDTKVDPTTAVTNENAAELTNDTSELTNETVEEGTAPKPEEVLLATDEGVRVAQVNDDASFSEAFADARAQVGAGGVFEWRGHVYATYYEEEWNNMTPEERAQYQAKIDYNAISGDEENMAENSQEQEINTPNTNEEIIATNAEMVDDDQQASTDIKVLGVEAVTDAQGNPITVAGVEIEGQAALLVDVDNDNMMDIIAVDENNDGQISRNEIYDFSDAHVSVNDLQQHMAMQQNPNDLLACNDGMPDYVNDADVSSLA